MITAPNPVVEVLVMEAAATRMAVAFGPPTTSWKKKWRRVRFCLPRRSDVRGKLVEKVCDFPTRRRENRTTMKEVVEIRLLVMVFF